jgi:hypothetical protein
LVADYCGISLFKVYQLNVFEYYYLLRDAAIYNYSQTEQGQKYLDNCWRIEQTNGDKKRLRELFGKEAK